MSHIFHFPGRKVVQKSVLSLSGFSNVSFCFTQEAFRVSTPVGQYRWSTLEILNPSTALRQWSLPSRQLVPLRHTQGVQSLFGISSLATCLDDAKRDAKRESQKRIGKLLNWFLLGMKFYAKHNVYQKNNGATFIWTRLKWVMSWAGCCFSSSMKS